MSDQRERLGEIFREIFWDTTSEELLDQRDRSFLFGAAWALKAVGGVDEEYEEWWKQIQEAPGIESDPHDQTLRDEVQRFAILMEKKLREKDEEHGGFDIHVLNPAVIAGGDSWWLHGRLLEEARELKKALDDLVRFVKAKSGDAEAAVQSECADVANFAMMISKVMDHQIRRKRKEEIDGGRSGGEVEEVSGPCAEAGESGSG